MDCVQQRSDLRTVNARHETIRRGPPHKNWVRQEISKDLRERGLPRPEETTYPDVGPLIRLQNRFLIAVKKAFELCGEVVRDDVLINLRRDGLHGVQVDL